jgi:hypothetical protein
MGFYPVGLVGAAALSNPVTIAQGGSGKTTAAAAFNALNPNAAPVTFQPGAPSTTVSTTQVMMGLGATVTYTPSGSGLTEVVFTAAVRTQTAQQPVTVGGRYGTGVAPTNGTAVTGTVFGPAIDPALSGSGAGNYTTFAVSEVLTLTPGTAYWFDAAIATGLAADAAGMANVSVSIFELPAG